MISVAAADDKEMNNEWLDFDLLGEMRWDEKMRRKRKREEEEEEDRKEQTLQYCITVLCTIPYCIVPGTLRWQIFMA